MTRSAADAPDWLTRAPVAHRGLHDRAAGRIENSLSAARAAVDAGFSIECDVQRSRDGEAVVFHDFSLDRLTSAVGPVADRDAAALAALRLGDTDDRILPLATFLADVADRVPVICEIKSAFDGDRRLTDRVCDVVAGYPGRLALKSFDPAVVANLRRRLGRPANRPLGIVAEGRYDDPEWAFLDAETRRCLAALTHVDDTEPDFLSFHVADLPHAAARLFRRACGGPVLTWTVRTPEQRDRASRWADAMIFEGFQP